MRWTLVCDGGSRGNPGPGYGSYRLRPPGGEWGAPVRLEFGDRVTNNQAEYRALIASLEALARKCDPAVTEVEVRCDSQLVIRQLRGEYKVKSPGLKPLYWAAVAAADRFARVDYVWQPREKTVKLLDH